jgi:penicillin G amidase
VNEFMFDGGPARRFIGEMTPQGPVAEEVIPGGESGVPGSPFRVDQLFLWLTNHYYPWPYRFK